MRRLLPYRWEASKVKTVVGRNLKMGIQEYLEEATRRGASDLFIVAGLPLTYKINLNMIRAGERLMP